MKLGALDPIRDFTFVEDTVDAFVRISSAEDVDGAVINVGAGKGISIGELAGLVSDVTGVSGRIDHEASRMRPERSEVDRLICDSSKAKARLGWEPRVTLREGLERTAAWIRANLEHYKSELFNL